MTTNFVFSLDDELAKIKEKCDNKTITWDDNFEFIARLFRNTLDRLEIIEKRLNIQRSDDPQK